MRAYPYARLPVLALAAMKWVPIALAVVAAVPVLLLSTRRGSPPAMPARAEPVRSIALTLTGEGGRLRLGWDRNAPAIQGGQCGALWIADGGILRRVLLDAGQLRAGTLFYWPVNRDFSFEIKMSEGKNRDETVCGADATALAQPLERLTRPQRRAERTPSRSRRHAAGMARPQNIGFLESDDVNGSGNARIESGNAPAFAIEGQWAAALPVHAAQLQAANVTEVLANAVMPSDQEGPGPYATVTVEAVADSRLNRIAGRIPLLRRLLGPPEFLPPRPVSETAPAVPAELGRTLNGEALLAVRAYINESGKVTFAEMLSNVTEANRGLAGLAVFDARHREFMPAQLGAQMVPGQAILRYRFGTSLLASHANHQ